MVSKDRDRQKSHDFIQHMHWKVAVKKLCNENLIHEKGTRQPTTTTTTISWIIDCIEGFKCIICMCDCVMTEHLL